MSFIKYRKLFIVLLLIWGIRGMAQDNFTGYWQPQLALNYKVSPLYSHNFSLANRNYFYRDAKTNLSTRQIDLAHFSTYKTSFNTSIGAGIQYRFREVFENDRENELRFTQQFNSTKKQRIVRFGNRLRSEQHITNAQTIHRFRYRFAIDLPLKGLELNLGEPYLIATTESLLSVGKGLSPEYDQRFTSQIGWLLGNKAKLQVGVEYRFEDYLGTTQQVFFFLNSLVVSL
jgi:hypothetical protein